MPLYEYQCGKCGSVFEVIQKFSDQPLAVHESCGGAVERLISAAALQFKGAGWYVNDYAKAGSAPGKASEGGEKKSAETKAGDAGSSSSSSSSGSSASSSGSPSAPAKSE